MANQIYLYYFIPMKVERNRTWNKYTFTPEDKEDEKFLDRVNGRIEQLEAENKSLKEVIERLHKEIEEQDKEYSKRLIEMAWMQWEIDWKTIRIDWYEKDIDFLRDYSDKLEKEIKNLKEIIDVKTKDYNDLVDELEWYKTEHERLVDKLVIKWATEFLDKKFEAKKWWQWD